MMRDDDRHDHTINRDVGLTNIRPRSAALAVIDRRTGREARRSVPVQRQEDMRADLNREM